MTVFGLGDLAFVGAVGGSRLWTPADITTALWLDAADASTITTVSGAVSQWNDKSGNNRHVGSSGSGPTVSSASLNGLSTLNFNGSQGLETSTNFPITGNPAFSIYCVYLKNAAFQGSFVGWGNTGLALAAAGFLDSTESVGLAYAGANMYRTTTPSIGSWLFFGYTKSPGAINTTSQAYRNGSDVSTGTHSSLTPNIASAQLRIGQWADFPRRLNGSMAELVITASNTSNAGRQLMEGYLAHKWGLAANLPNDHPYKGAAPTVWPLP